MYGLTIEEGVWLVRLSQGRLKKSLAGLGLSDSILDSLIDGGLLALKDGVVEVAANGMAKAFCFTGPVAL